MSQHFHVEEQRQNGRRVLVLRGELDLETAAELEAQLSGDVDTVVDLCALSFMDSTGVRVLVRAAQRAKEAGWRLEVRNPQTEVRRLIKLVGIAELLGLRSG